MARRPLLVGVLLLAQAGEALLQAVLLPPELGQFGARQIGDRSGRRSQLGLPVPQLGPPRSSLLAGPAWCAEVACQAGDVARGDFELSKRRGNGVAPVAAGALGQVLNAPSPDGCAAARPLA